MKSLSIGLKNLKNYQAIFKFGPEVELFCKIYVNLSLSVIENSLNKRIFIDFTI